MQLLGATLLSRYKVERILGSGGFGDTYLARDTALPHAPFCVVKHLKPKMETPEVQAIAQSLFEREAHMLYQLGECDSIPRLFAHFEEQGQFFLVQEFIEGHNLSVELEPGKPWPSIQVKKLLHELLSVLSLLHQQHVIHRDIKPENIMRRQKDDRLFLIDFGAVKEIPQLTVTDTGATALTVAIGSPGYMPSEQAVGKPKAASDIYAVGMIAIQALTGKSPSQLPTDPNTGDRLWTIPADVSAEMAAFLKRMTHDHFSQRYPSAMEALAAFEQLDQNLEATTVQPNPQVAPILGPSAQVPATEYQTKASDVSDQSKSQKNWMPWAFSSVGLVALGAGLVMMLQPGSVQVTSKTQSSELGQSSINVKIQRHQDTSSTPSPATSVPEDLSNSQHSPSEPAPQPVSAVAQNHDLAQTALVIDPPSNIRRTPNGEIICAVSSPQTIVILSPQGDWYPTDFCGESGFIHKSQLRLKTQQAWVIDPPSNVRSQPNGQILCVINQRSQIEVSDQVAGWYRTNICQTEEIGYIHHSQLSLN